MKVYLMINIVISVLHSQSVQSFIYCSFSTFSKKMIYIQLERSVRAVCQMQKTKNKHTGP